MLWNIKKGGGCSDGFNLMMGLSLATNPSQTTIQKLTLVTKFVRIKTEIKVKQDI